MKAHNKSRFFVNIPVALVADALKSVVLVYMWSWFVVPLGVVEIEVPHAFGLLLMKGMLFRSKPDPTVYKDTPEAVKNELVVILLSFIPILMAFLFGAGVHALM